MKFLIFIICVALFSAVGEYFLPWWIFAVLSFGISFVMKMRPGSSFIAGFLGISIFWLAAAMLRDIPNNHLLSTRVADIFHLPSYGLLFAIVAILGGLIGGLAAWAATFFFTPRNGRNTIH